MNLAEYRRRADMPQVCLICRSRDFVLLRRSLTDTFAGDFIPLCERHAEEVRKEQFPAEQTHLAVKKLAGWSHHETRRRFKVFNANRFHRVKASVKARRHLGVDRTLVHCATCGRRQWVDAAPFQCCGRDADTIRTEKKPAGRPSLPRLLALVPDLRAAAQKSGLTITVMNRQAHWQFRASPMNEHVIDFWPATGRWFCPRLRERGRVTDPWAVLAVAKILKREHYAEI